ncbi:Aste57867_14062 [Aphanomyces stellatus]|uniref:Aste57867_14062 protein n=1 Tax=Aphanomyces stellatus TaxID=120398 RepID=A0A485KZU1_9STRA|nr:hypothetical protein As57867_014011 [Aphanomyces stellatus]VFT90890.1 Aste57867_14062 [Aphanomyces stellatus]
MPVPTPGLSDSERPVFTPQEISCHMTTTLETIDEEYPKEIEARLYPISKQDVRTQLKRIRERRRNPSHEDILKTLDLDPSQAHLLSAPAEIEDEGLGLQRSSETLQKCDEAQRANRDFKPKAVASLSWTKGNPYAVKDESQVPASQSKRSSKEPGLNHSTSVDSDSKSQDDINSLLKLQPRPRPRPSAAQGQAHTPFD